MLFFLCCPLKSVRTIGAVHSTVSFAIVFASRRRRRERGREGEKEGKRGREGGQATGALGTDAIHA